MVQWRLCNHSDFECLCDTEFHERDRARQGWSNHYVPVESSWRHLDWKVRFQKFKRRMALDCKARRVERVISHSNFLAEWRLHQHVAAKAWAKLNYVMLMCRGLGQMSNLPVVVCEQIILFWIPKRSKQRKKRPQWKTGTFGSARSRALAPLIE